VTPDAYHRLPGFSASLARVILSESERHAKDLVARRAEREADEDEGDDEADDDKQDRLDKGTILHALVLGVGASRIEVVPSALLSKSGSYGTAAGKAARDAARKAGLVPVKEQKMEVYQRTADAMLASIRSAGHELSGTSEYAIEWWENTPHGPLRCRCMLDHVEIWNALPGSVGAQATTPRAEILELKTIPSAHPDRCQRTAENLHYAVACVAYQRALAALYPRLGGRILFTYLWQETRRPYDLWDPKPSGAYLEIGERRWIRARNAWAEGLATGVFPGYRRPANYTMTAPMWTLTQEGFTPDEL
jgi:hypothetical protein